jgi:hypothetical protein
MVHWLDSKSKMNQGNQDNHKNQGSDRCIRLFKYCNFPLMNYKNFANQIVMMKNADLAFRDKLVKSGELSNGYNAEMEQIHIENSEKLEGIINQIGYPTIDKVGKEANEAAWLIIQHAISQPGFMKKCAELLSIEVSLKNTDPKQLAYLTDRIAVFEDKLQLFGTNFDWDENGELNPNNYDDLIKVNQRRKSIGLNSLEEQTEIIRQHALAENQFPPADFQAKKLQYEYWRKRVGWMK